MIFFFKIRIFLWLIRKKKILTKDNLVHRGWMKDTSCVFYGTYENIDHLFVTCQEAKCYGSVFQVITGLLFKMFLWMTYGLLILVFHSKINYWLN
jgi:zinc-binding in reverse transcriptase